MAVILDYSGGLDRLKEAILEDATDATDDEKLRRWILQASKVITTLARGRRFVPFIDTRYYDHPREPATIQWGGTQYSYDDIRFSDTLRLDEDLLEVDTLTTENGNTTIQSSDQFLMSGDNYNRTPYNRIVLKLDGDQNTFLYSGTTQQANAVTGTWGWHDDWGNAWVDTLDTVEDNPLSSSATTLTVNDVDGADLYGQTPRISPGMILKVESEYLYVTATDTASNTATIIRGINGSTAASHAQNTAINSYQVPFDIQNALITLVGFWNSVGTSSFAVASKRIGDYRVDYGDPADMVDAGGFAVPAHVASIIKAHRRTNV